MSVERLVLHAGWPDAGAAGFQETLAAHRPSLRAQGILLVGAEDLRLLPAYDGWSAHGRAAADVGQEFTAQLRALVGSTAGGHRTAECILVSTPDLLGTADLGPGDVARLRPDAVDAVAQLLDAVPAREVTVVLHTRRQDRLMESCYERAVTAGAWHRFDEQFPRRLVPWIDFVELADRLAVVPGVDSVVVRPVEVALDPAGVVADVLSAARLPVPRGAADTAVGAAPRRLTKEALEVAAAMNRHLDTEAERRVVHEFVLERLGADGTEPVGLITEGERSQILTAYAEVNRELFVRLLPGLPQLGYASDDRTLLLSAPPPPAHERAVGAVHSSWVRTRRTAGRLRRAVARRRSR